MAVLAVLKQRHACVDVASVSGLRGAFDMRVAQSRHLFACEQFALHAAEGNLIATGEAGQSQREAHDKPRNAASRVAYLPPVDLGGEVEARLQRMDVHTDAHRTFC